MRKNKYFNLFFPCSHLTNKPADTAITCKCNCKNDIDAEIIDKDYHDLANFYVYIFLRKFA